MSSVSQDVLTTFSNSIVGVAGYFAAGEGTQHVIVGTSDGTLTEVYWKSGQGVHQDVLATFTSGIADVGGYYVTGEGTQHVIVGTSDGNLTEVYWKSGQGVNQDVLTTFSNSISGVAGYFVPGEGTQHAIVGTNDGTLTEVYWKSGQGVHQDVLANFLSGIVEVGGYYVAGEGTQHVIVGTSDGNLTEVYWKSGQGVNQDVLTTFSNSIIGVAGYYVPTEGTQHAIVATGDGNLTEVYWKSGQGVNQDVLTNFASGISDVGGYYVTGEGTQHAIAGNFDGTLNEVANGLAGTHTALAPLPGGSTNVFARTIGLPNDPIEATGALLDGLTNDRIERVGLGSVNGRYFLFHVGLGFDAVVVKQVERRAGLKRYASHPLFIYATFATWFRHYDRSRPRFSVREDQGPVIDDGYFAICFNTNPYTYLGNRPFNVIPEATLDRGLAIVTFRSLGLWALGRAAASALGFGRDIRRLKHLDVRSDLTNLTVDGHGPFPYQVDGDYLGETEHLVFRHEPEILRLVMPV